MPNRDKTGPQGQGPKTGRGLGACADSNLAYGQGAGRCPKQGAGRRPRRSAGQGAGRRT